MSQKLPDFDDIENWQLW